VEHEAGRLAVFEREANALSREMAQRQLSLINRTGKVVHPNMDEDRFFEKYIDIIQPVGRPLVLQALSKMQGPVRNQRQSSRQT
jgi:hypothetical protein